MKTRRSLAVVLLAISAFAEKPNIVFILADDMGVGDISGLNSAAKLKTPNVDVLIKDGMHFTDAHTSSSVCTPTRYGLMTGRYNWRSELKARVLGSYSPALIPPERDTVASLLKRNGYKTAIVGKWHLGLNWQRKDGAPVPKVPREPIGSEIDFTKSLTGGPCDLGFDYWFGCSASLDFPPYTWIENDRVVDVPTEQRPFQGGKKVGQPELMMRAGLQVPGFRPERVLKGLTEKAVEIIGQQTSGEPFFLYMPLTAPHTPVVPRDEFMGTSGCGVYGDFIQEIDWAVGQVVTALDKQGLLENTLLIFTADNGASKMSFTLELEKQFDHHPSGIYKGRKASLDEGGHRVPFIACWPGNVMAGARCDTACNLNDFYATCAELMGETIADTAGEDSFSMLPLLQGKTEDYSRNGMVHHDFPGRFAFRDGKWKLKFHDKPERYALHDLEADPSEKKNLYTSHPEVVEQLEKKLTKIVMDGRSTPGAPQKNDGAQWWEQLVWMDEK